MDKAEVARPYSEPIGSPPGDLRSAVAAGDQPFGRCPARAARGRDAAMYPVTIRGGRVAIGWVVPDRQEPPRNLSRRGRSTRTGSVSSPAGCGQRGIRAGEMLVSPSGRGDPGQSAHRSIDHAEVVVHSQRFVPAHPFVVHHGSGQDLVEASRTGDAGWRSEPDGVQVGVCDFTPKWHVQSGKLLGTGHSVRYRNNALIGVRTRETVWSVYDPRTKEWSPWAVLDMPKEDKFWERGCGEHATNRSGQRRDPVADLLQSRDAKPTRRPSCAAASMALNSATSSTAAS